MPRKSLRLKTIELLQLRLSKLKKQCIQREMMDEEDSIEDDKYLHLRNLLKKMLHSRYIFRHSKYRKKRRTFDLDDALSSTSDHYNDDEFLSTFRITRESFFLLLQEMKGTKAFTKKSKKKQQRPVAFQLLVFLFRVGKEACGASSEAIGIFFGIAKGSVTNYVRRCVSAFLEMKEDNVYWPDKIEREEMRKRMSVFGFRHCVGIIDGTLIALAFRPEAYHECYFSRKSMYALNVMIVCDDKKRIIFYNAGWPGSTHDNRVFRNSKLFYNRGDYFSHREYLLGDSAYSASPVMVQAFKKEATVAELPQNHAFFNTKLAQVRIASEHCIGILKGRFPCLKQNNIKLKNSKAEVKELVELVGACIVLHNMLIDYDEDPIPESWYEHMNDEIDWGMYDEEEEHIEQVTEDKVDRRKYVYNSLVNNYIN